eukprot:scaffold28.g7579.t1
MTQALGDESAKHGRDAIVDSEVQPILAHGGAATSGGPSGLAPGAREFGVYHPWHPRSLARNAVFRHALFNLFLICSWYFFGTLLSLWNKILLSKDHGLFGNGAFPGEEPGGGRIAGPAPFLMSGVQFYCQHLIARGALALGLARRKAEGSMSWAEYMRKVVPNGVATGLDIGFSNYSLVFITLSFYVMCKSTTPLFLLAFAIAWGIEQPSWQLGGVVCVISAGLLLLVAGETRFDLVGFLLVMSAAMLAGLRWTITQVLLQGAPGASAAHGSPVEVLHQLTPVMGHTMMALALAHERLWATLPGSPYFAGAGAGALTTLIMLAGGAIAFMMVLAEFTLIANTSALTFMVAGTFKEIVTVGAAVLFLGERFTWVNALGLVVLLCGVVLFNIWKWQRMRAGDLVPVPLELDPQLKLTTEVEAEAALLGGGASGAANGGLPGGGHRHPGAPHAHPRPASEVGSEVEMQQQQHGGVEVVPLPEQHAVFVLEELEEQQHWPPLSPRQRATAAGRQLSGALYGGGGSRG